MLKLIGGIGEARQVAFLVFRDKVAFFDED